MPGQHALRLPKVLVTEVVRSTHQGDSHGGAYLVDLETGDYHQVLDWNTIDISWEGRGADRGLRGIAFQGDNTIIAASDEIFVFDRDFKITASHTNPHLSHCHEIWLEGSTLSLSSTGRDAVLELDLHTARFTSGWWISAEPIGSGVNLSLIRFDPESPLGQSNAAPPHRDTLHINSVSRCRGATLVGCQRLPALLAISEGQLAHFAPITLGTHNAQPFENGVIYNSTPQDALVIADQAGNTRRSIPVPRYNPERLTHTDLPEDHARQAFARGLCYTDDHVIIGSSPTTITAFRRDTWEQAASVNITMDVRHCPHGLRVWPH